ncbi:growth-regulated alpha protein-like [Conger conger]|uniref:growth-regulated alpha protein-like n=1 Tax=Conger conger TaxID=82655 RepID=UPI002A5A6FD7|nr:growth-regulated alpha protein-like [Conger conger]
MHARKSCAVFSWLLLLLWFAGSGGDNAATAMTVRGRCPCVGKAHLVHPKRITDITVQQKNALCSETQIILTVEGNREVCLDPDSEQGQRLQHCWKSYDMNVAKTKTCLRRKKTIH